MENIAFVGKMGVGKSYYAAKLKQELSKNGINANIVSISSKIKATATDLFNMHGKDRDLLQGIAGKMREIDSDVWIKYLISDIKKFGRLPFIVDDLRFSSEMRILKDNFNVIIVKLEAEESARIMAYTSKYGIPPTEKELSDPTETSSDDITADLLITNDYTEETVSNNIAKIIKAAKA